MNIKLFQISPLTNTFYKRVLKLPTPSSISYWWNIGSLLGIVLVIQIIRGLFLSFHYNSSILFAFDSIIHIMRDVWGGYLIRYIHRNGASLFFIFVYLHISRGLLFSSFKKREVWFSGIIILFILIATAFVGYVLPWGQISFWGATVITNLISTIPYLGKSIVEWLWGGYSVSGVTLNRFFSFHFLLPFILIGLVINHLIVLHKYGSSNPLGLNSNLDKIIFHPFFSLKDVLAPSLIFIFFIFICLILPNLLGDTENWNPASPLNTPVHIQPEWYFLFAYAILRSVPNKLGGVICLIIRILILGFLCVIKKNISSSKFNWNHKLIFWWYSFTFIILTWIGANPVEYPYESIGKIVRIIYFIIILNLYLFKDLSWK